MRVAIAVPPFDYARTLYGMKFVRRVRNAFPMGACYVAGMLRAHGHEIAIIDSPSLQIDEAECVQRLVDFGADCIGISTTTLLSTRAYSLGNAIRAAMPDVPIVFGGVHPTLYPGETLRDCPGADISVIDEGEITMLEICKRLESGSRDMTGVAGLYWRAPDGTIRQEAHRKPIRPLDQVPMPALDVLELERYRTLPSRAKREPAIYMQTSRGCAWSGCRYCTDSGGLRTKYRRFSPERIVSEISRAVTQWGIREIAFIDDDFIDRSDWVERFCAQLKKAKLDVTWSFFSRPRMADYDRYKMMVDAGAWMTLMGIENGNSHILRNMRKDTDAAQNAQAVKIAQSAGFEVMGLFIIGLPGETPETVQHTIRYVKETGFDYAIFSMFHPCYGTTLFDELGLSKEDFITNWGIHNHVYWLPDGFKDEYELRYWYTKAYRDVYMNPGYVVNFLKKRRGAEDIRTLARGGLHLADYVASLSYSALMA